MIISMEKSALRTEKWYSGQVSEYVVSENRLIVHVSFKKEPDSDFVMVVPISNKLNSDFAEFANQLQLYNEDGNVDLSFLDNVFVKAKLRRSKTDGKIYISSMMLDEKAMEKYFGEETMVEKYEDRE